MTSFSGLQDAVGVGCVDGDLVRLDESVEGGDLTIACDVTVDMNGSDIRSGTVGLESATSVTLTDLSATGDAGTLTATGSSSNAGVGTAGIRTTSASLMVNGRVVVEASGGAQASGIGGDPEQAGGTLAVAGDADVVATGGEFGAGIGGGIDAAGGRLTVGGNARLVATGGDGGAGVGGGFGGTGGTTTIGDRSRVTAVAVGSLGGVGIGSGGAGRLTGAGGTTTVSGTAVATAKGGTGAVAVGGGLFGLGGATTIVDGGPGGDARLNVIPGPDAPIALRAGPAGGGLTVRQGTVNVVSGELDALRTPADGPEVTIGAGGVIESRMVDGQGQPTQAGSGRLTTPRSGVSAGRISNGGAITLPTTAVSDELEISDHHYDVRFVTTGGGASDPPTPVRVFASSFTAGARGFPPPPTRPGFVFAGWNTREDGSGENLSATGELPAAGSTGGQPVIVTAYAQWTRDPIPPPPVDPPPPVIEPVPTVDVSIDGRPKVGQRLSAGTSLAGNDDAVSYRYQWTRDGVAIQGADSPRYRPTRADIAREVAAVVTASAPGRSSRTASSEAVAIRPVVGMVGMTRVGRELSPRVVVPAGARVSYKWQASPRPNRARVWQQVAASKTYTLTRSERRHRIRLVVRILGPGFTPVTSYSTGRFVAPARRDAHGSGQRR